MTTDMMPLLAEITLRATIVLAFGWAITIAMRRAAASTRHFVWVCALGAVAAAPLATMAAPAWSVPAPAGLEPMARAVLPLLEDAPAPPPRDAAPVVVAGPAETAAIESDVPAGLAAAVSRRQAAGFPRWNDPRLAAAIWLAGAILVLAYALAGHLAVWRMRRRASPAVGGWNADLRALVPPAGDRRRIVVVQSSAIGTPLVCGMLRPAIVLPDGAGDWLEDRRRIVLLHEVAHIRRRDCLSQAAAQLVASLHWFNPLVWLAIRRLRTERERACDDAVLASGVTPSAYAGHLLHLARESHGRRASPLTAAAVAMAHRSEIERRLASILDPSRRRAPGRAAQAGAAVVFVLLSLPLAAVPPAVDASELPRPQEPAPTARPGVVPGPEPSEPEPPVDAVPGAVRGGVDGGVPGVVRGGVPSGVRGGVPGSVRGRVPGGIVGSVPNLPEPVPPPPSQAPGDVGGHIETPVPAVPPPARPAPAPAAAPAIPTPGQVPVPSVAPPAPVPAAPAIPRLVQPPVPAVAAAPSAPGPAAPAIPMPGQSPPPVVSLPARPAPVPAAPATPTAVQSPAPAVSPPAPPAPPPAAPAIATPGQLPAPAVSPPAPPAPPPVAPAIATPGQLPAPAVSPPAPPAPLPAAPAIARPGQLPAPAMAPSAPTAPVPADDPASPRLVQPPVPVPPPALPAAAGQASSAARRLAEQSVEAAREEILLLLEALGRRDMPDELRVRLLEAWLAGQLRFDGTQREFLDGALAGTLMRFAAEGSVDGIAAMLASGADINARGSSGTPLIAAAYGGHVDAVGLLLERGADPNRMLPGVGSPLGVAAANGHVAVAARLLDAGAVVDQIVPSRETALIQASANGHLGMVQLLVARGADVNVRVWVDPMAGRSEGEWRTALAAARRAGHEEVASYLLTQGPRQ